MSFDPGAHRDESLQTWEAAASGWRRQQELMRSFTAPVSQWMVEALQLQPGEQVLELAAGLAETGLLAAELVAPGGSVIISDQAEAMLEGARERARELGIDNVEFRVLNAEWIDLAVASVDAVLCRWGYMLMADPAAALGETRRVLRPGGRVALAVWDAIERNPWASIPRDVLLEHGAGRSPDPAPQPGAPADESHDQAPPPANPFIGGAPGPFALGDEERLLALLQEAGFAEIEIRALDLARRQASFAELWDSILDTSPFLHDVVMSRQPAEIEAIEAAVADRFQSYAQPDGSLQVPGRTLVALASA